MKQLYTFLITLFLAVSSISIRAKSLVRVKALGSSPRGQYVAFEEFGYQNGRKRPFSKIRIMNVWKNKYVERPVHVIGINTEDKLSNIRSKAKDMAIKSFKKFNISI